MSRSKQTTGKTTTRKARTSSRPRRDTASPENFELQTENSPRSQIEETATRLTVHFHLAGRASLVFQMEEALIGRLFQDVRHARLTHDFISLAEYKDSISCLNYNDTPLVSWMDVMPFGDDVQLITLTQ